MNARTFAPEGTLAGFIHSFVYYTHYNPDHNRERVIPDGGAYLIIALDGRPRRVYQNESLEPVAEFRDVWLSGVQREYLTIESLRESSMAAIRFCPGGARPLLGTLLDQSLGQILPAQRLDAIGAMDLCRRLRASESPEAAWTVVCEWAERLLRGATDSPPESIRIAVQEIAEDPGFLNTGLAELVDASGYSQKQFIHHFKRHVGLTPKVFQRMLRFHEILPRVINRDEISWCDISHRCGYYDQSHFIREFHLFSGYNPTEFLRGPANRTNFIPVAER